MELLGRKLIQNYGVVYKARYLIIGSVLGILAGLFIISDIGDRIFFTALGMAVGYIVSLILFKLHLKEKNIKSKKSDV